MAEAAVEEKTPEVTTSKTIVLVGFGGYDKLKIQQKPKPKAEKGEVVVKVKATGINFAELMARQGFYDRTPKTPCVLGFEAAGVVEELGEDVSDLKVGHFTINSYDILYNTRKIHKPLNSLKWLN